MTQETANTSLNERVIEAAAAAYHSYLRTAMPRILISDGVVDVDARINAAIEAAIKAADQARAPEIIAAVADLNALMDAYDVWLAKPGDQWLDRDEIIRRLLALFSIEAPT